MAKTQEYTGKAEQMTHPPFPEKMSFKEMFDSLFNRDFMTEEEFKTICDAAEMYANGRLKHAADLGYQLAAPVSSEEGMIEKARQFMRDKGFKGIAEHTTWAAWTVEFCNQHYPTPSTPQGEVEQAAKEYGEWQLCPKCLGDGNLMRYNSPPMTNATPICDVCYGSKIIAKPSWQSLSSESSGANQDELWQEFTADFIKGEREILKQKFHITRKQSKP